MAVLHTDLRVTRNSAARTRFEPTTTITATNVQDAIEEAAAAASSGGAITATNVSSSPYTVLPEDLILLVDTSVPRTITLPFSAMRAGLPLEIKDVTGQAATNNIAIVSPVGQTIDGVATWVIDQAYGDVKIFPKPSGGYTQVT